jgi:hypothetical protein
MKILGFVMMALGVILSLHGLITKFKLNKEQEEQTETLTPIIGGALLSLCGYLFTVI